MLWYLLLDLLLWLCVVLILDLGNSDCCVGCAYCGNLVYF